MDPLSSKGWDRERNDDIPGHGTELLASEREANQPRHPLLRGWRQRYDYIHQYLHEHDDDPEIHHHHIDDDTKPYDFIVCSRDKYDCDRQFDRPRIEYNDATESDEYGIADHDHPR